MKNGNYLGIYFYALRQIEDLKSPHFSNVFENYLQRYTSFCPIKQKNIFHFINVGYLQSSNSIRQIYLIKVY